MLPTEWINSAAAPGWRPAADGRPRPTPAHRRQRQHRRARPKQEPGVCRAVGLLKEPSLVSSFPATGRNGSRRRRRLGRCLPRGQHDLRGGLGAKADLGQLSAERRSLCRRRNQARRRTGRRGRLARWLCGSVAAARPAGTIGRLRAAVVVSRNRRLAGSALQTGIDVRLRILLRLRRTRRALRRTDHRGSRGIAPAAGRRRRNRGKLAGNRCSHRRRRAA